MAQNAKQRILEYVIDKGGVEVRMSELALRAKLSGCKHPEIEQAVDELIAEGKLTRSFNRDTKKVKLGPVRVRA